MDVFQEMVIGPTGPVQAPEASGSDRDASVCEAPGTSARNGAQTRAALIAAASAMLGENGIDSLSLRQLAARAGCTATAIYRHFTGKDALLAAIAATAFADLEGKLRAAGERSREPRMRLRRVMLAYLAYGAENPALYGIMFLRSEGAGSPEIIAGRARIVEVMREAAAAALAGQETSLLTPFALADGLWAQLHGLVALAGQLPPEQRPRLEAAAEAALALLRRALDRPEPARGLASEAAPGSPSAGA